jgi:hypothetical protein
LYAHVSLAVTHAYMGDVEEATTLIAEAKSLPTWGEGPLPEWKSIVH